MRKQQFQTMLAAHVAAGMLGACAPTAEFDSGQAIAAPLEEVGARERAPGAEPRVVLRGTLVVDEGADAAGLALLDFGVGDSPPALRAWTEAEELGTVREIEQLVTVTEAGTLEHLNVGDRAPFEETVVHLAAGGVHIGSLSVVTVPPGFASELAARTAETGGILDSGPGYVVVDEAAALDDDPRGLSVLRVPDGAQHVMGLCWCPWSGNVASLTIDPSTKGKLAMWLIPENGSAAFTPVKAGNTYSTDGFKIGSQIYKVDGSTCNTMLWSGGWGVWSCVNNLALLLGKKAPYPVPNGTFGNEPPAGSAAKPVY